MNVLHTFASNVKRLRNETGISQEAFADECGLHRTYISLIEREKRNVSIKCVEKIAAALDVEPYVLFVDPDNLPRFDYAVCTVPQAEERQNDEAHTTGR